jgi:hypothetical protein
LLKGLGAVEGVIPAQAGIQGFQALWMPVFTGMTIETIICLK